MTQTTIDQPPRYFRTGKTTAPVERVDRRGGFRGAGVIRGVSVITRGEALGHDLWVDSEMLSEVADAINAPNRGIKSRFTHPNLSGDGLGKFTGRVMDAEVVGDQVIADQHFTDAGHTTPDGDLADYLMTLAEDADAFGLSIVFDLDATRTAEFQDEHTEGGEFVSPDPENTKNLPHARLGSLRAVDAVDEPAANPGGLFHRENELVSEAEQVARFALGLSETRPDVVRLGLDAERVRGFVTRFLKTNNLELVEMAENETTTPDEDEKDTEVLTVVGGELEVEATEADAAEDTTPATPEPVAASDRSEAAKFFDAFGTDGAVWFAEGKTFDECSALQVKNLKTENDNLKRQLSAVVSSGEASPVEFEADEAEQPKRRGFAGRIRIAG
tara:strand:+ start:14 stop:1174 length:1161 start_codon:yes stop_codon:yes gene_type:complete